LFSSEFAARHKNKKKKGSFKYARQRKARKVKKSIRVARDERGGNGKNVRGRERIDLKFNWYFVTFH